jgi:anti-anti-sigma factor
MLKVRRIEQFGFPILQVAGNLDLTTFGRLLTEVVHLLENRPQTLGLDLSQVTLADASAVSLVATAAEWMAEHDGKLRLLDTSPAFEEAVRKSGPFLRPHSHLEVYHQVA